MKKLHLNLKPSLQNENMSYVQGASNEWPKIINNLSIKKWFYDRNLSESPETFVQNGWNVLGDTETFWTSIPNTKRTNNSAEWENIGFEHKPKNVY